MYLRGSIDNRKKKKKERNAYYLLIPKRRRVNDCFDIDEIYQEIIKKERERECITFDIERESLSI